MLTIYLWLISSGLCCDAFIMNNQLVNNVKTINSHPIDMEICEGLIMNGIVTAGSLRIMDKVFIPEKENNMVKCMIILSSCYCIYVYINPYIVN